MHSGLKSPKDILVIYDGVCKRNVTTVLILIQDSTTVRRRLTRISRKLVSSERNGYVTVTSSVSLNNRSRRNSIVEELGLSYLECSIWLFAPPAFLCEIFEFVLLQQAGPFGKRLSPPPKQSFSPSCDLHGHFIP